MRQFLMLRNDIIKFYKSNEPISEIVLRFIGGAVVFSFIASFMPYSILSLKYIAVVILGGIITIFATPSIFLVSAGIVISLCTALSSLEAGGFMALFLFVAYIMYGRIFPKESLLFVAMLVLSKFKLPFLAPILAGIYVGPAGIVPVCAAVFAGDFAYIIRQIITEMPTNNFSVSSILESSVTSIQYIYEGIWGSKGILAVCAVMVIGIIISWAINTSFFDREKEKAVAANTIILIVGTIVCFFMTYSAKIISLGIFGIIISAIISAAIALVITYFDCIRNYGKTEKVQFQDSNYVYYVKAVPKIEFSDDYKPKHHNSTKKINDGLIGVKKAVNKKSKNT